MNIQINISVDTDGLEPRDVEAFKGMVETQINTALRYLNFGEACVCQYARYRYHRPENYVTISD